MQSLRDQDKLIPRPRGSLPLKFAVALALLVAVGLLIWTQEKFLGLVAQTILYLTLGPLLHGICLLVEEVMHHSNTRYRGQSLVRHMLAACGLGGKTMLTAALAGPVLYLLQDPLSNKYRCWELLLLVSVLYPLLRSLGVLGPSEVEVSEICEGRKMNVAHGLAWSFYLGYLRLVLPHLDNSITTFCAKHKNEDPFSGRGSRKLLILIPLNAKTSHKLEDEDTNIRFYRNLPNVEITRAGVHNRVFKHSVYTVQDEHKRVHFCLMENATPLLTLYGMSQESQAEFGQKERRHQVLLFYRTLQDILDQSLECHNRFKLILLDDKCEDDPHFLSKAILQNLEQQEKEEFFLNQLPKQETVHHVGGASPFPPTAPPLMTQRQQRGPMTSNPSLQFSEDNPCSLREAAENTYG